MDNIKVSVIVPVYNDEEYIQTSISSIMNQEFSETYEIIVVDDGSTDNSLDIAQELLSKAAIPYKLVHQRNSGVSVARNHGIEVSRGDYLVFVDSDDYILTNHLSELYNGKTDFTLTQMAKEGVKSAVNSINYPELPLSAHDLIKMELQMMIPEFSFCQLMYKADLIKDNSLKFDSKAVYGEDTEFALKALSYGKSVAIGEEITYLYIQRKDSATSKAGLNRFNFIETLEKLSEFYKSRGQNELANLVITSRIPRAIFGNMNYFFYHNYDFDEVISKMEDLDLFSKLSRFKGDSKFKFKIKLFLLNPKLYYKMWKKFKNTI